jgi:hypothetical protein
MRTPGGDIGGRTGLRLSALWFFGVVVGTITLVSVEINYRMGSRIEASIQATKNDPTVTELGRTTKFAADSDGALIAAPPQTDTYSQPKCVTRFPSYSSRILIGNNTGKTICVDVHIKHPSIVSKTIEVARDNIGGVVADVPANSYGYICVSYCE